jgi:hypothetical protein
MNALNEQQTRNVYMKKKKKKFLYLLILQDHVATVYDPPV